jgi:hypothetical protein
VITVDRPDPLVYASVLQRLRLLWTDADADADEADQITKEIDLIVRLMIHPVRCPTSAHRWAWRPPLGLASGVSDVPAHDRTTVRHSSRAG